MKKILSIDAGGIRGIIPSIILAEIEARAGQPICDLFDFFAGTSTGGLLVLGLNCPEAPGSTRPLYSASELPRIFYEWGHRIFATKLATADQPRLETTSAERIEAMLGEYFGDALLSDCVRPTLVTAFDLTGEQPFFFNSATTDGDILGDVFMWQAARATTAIPSHFEPLRLAIPSFPSSQAQEVSLIDGSLFAANPAMCASSEARAFFPAEHDFLLISLGCGQARPRSAAADSGRQKRRLADYSLTAQSNCVHHQLRTLLPRQRYVRIETVLPPGVNRIDDASTMIAMERAAGETIASHSDLLERVVNLLSPNLELAAA